MPKLNVYGLERPERPVQEFTFEERGHTLTVSFRRPDAADLAIAAELSERLTQDYLTGNPDLGRGPAPFPYPDVKPSRSLFHNACVAKECQVVENPADAYDEVEWLLIAARLPETWLKILRVLQGLLEGPTDPKEPSPAAPTG
jgi:hypothetical protein